jgi:hypothetical protein
MLFQCRIIKIYSIKVRKEGKGLVFCKGGDNYTPCSSLILKENIKDINNLDLELRVAFPINILNLG